MRAESPADAEKIPECPSSPSAEHRTMRRTRLLTIIIGPALIGCSAIALYATRDRWQSWIPGSVDRFEPAADPIIERRPLHEWVADLSSADPDVRGGAAETLGNAGKSFPRANHVVQALHELFHDPDVQVRAAAIVAIGKVRMWAQNESATLLELARDDDVTIRASALQALAPLVDSDERIEQYFRVAMQEQNPDARGVMFDLLIDAAPQSASASALIADALNSEDEDIRLRALIASCRIAPEPRTRLGTICEMLHQPNMHLRRKAAEAANRICASADKTAIWRRQGEGHNAAEEPDKEKPDQAESEKPWLDELPDSGKIRAALIAALKDSDAHVRSELAEAVGRLGSTVKDAKPALENLLSDSTPAVRANAVAALGNFGPAAADAETRMLALLKDENPHVRDSSIIALRKIGADPKPLVRPLIAALDAPRRKQRHESAAALGDMLAIPDKLSDDEYREIFFALMRKAQKDQDELLAKHPSEFILPVHGIALEHLWRVDTKVVLIVVPALLDRLKAATGRTRDLWTRALTDLLNGAGYARTVRAQKDVFLDSEAGRSARAVLQAAVPVLMEELNSPDKSMRDTAAAALASIGPEAKAAVLELGERLKSKDKRQYLELNFSLRQFGPDAEAAVPVLIELIHSNDIEIQVPATISLEMIGARAKEAVPTLLEVIQDERADDNLAIHAAAALYVIDAEIAKRSLKEPMKNSARRVLEERLAQKP
jgi:HEAT repeat protein